jgi:hypothetical protein
MRNGVRSFVSAWTAMAIVVTRGFGRVAASATLPSGPLAAAQDDQGNRNRTDTVAALKDSRCRSWHRPDRPIRRTPVK